MPPPAQAYLRFSFTHYQGEEHPDARKVVLDVPVHELFGDRALQSVSAKYKFLLLAGARWLPADAAVVARVNDARAKGEAELGEALGGADLGTVKIASRRMPHQSQNMKWCSDVLDRMIDEANVCRAPLRHSRQKPPSFSDVPLDPRPYIKSNSRGGRTRIASADDFPMHWL